MRLKQFLANWSNTSIFSLKKDGVRLYEHARAGESIEIASRKTTIQSRIWIILPEIDFRVFVVREHIFVL
jgi:tRNA pseudouridine55 synthase